MLLRNLSALSALLLTALASVTSAEGQSRDSSSETADTKSPGDYCNDGDVHQQMRCRMKLSVARNLCFFSDPDPNKCLARAMRSEEQAATPRSDVRRCMAEALAKNESSACSALIAAPDTRSHDKALAYAYRAYARVNQSGIIDPSGQAIGDVRQSLEIDPTIGIAHYVWGAMLSMPGTEQTYKAGIGHLDRAIALGLPSHELALAYSFRGNDHRMLGTIENDKAQDRLAIEDFGRELSLNPKDTETYFSRAQLEQEFGMKREARSDLETYRRLGGQDR